MGQRQRQLREELERREKEVTNGLSSPSNGLGAGGGARVAAMKLDELRKQGDAQREKQSRARSVAWETARDSAKKRRASSGSNSSTPGVTNNDDGDDDLEKRTVRVKWSTKKESHSDHTLDVLFSRFGTVESVSIEEGSGNRALVIFASTHSADAAVAAYRDSETMRASYVGKRRPKRSAFAARRQTMSPPLHRQAAVAAGEEEGTATANSFRDRESLVMMKLRQEAERQALMRKMAEEEGGRGVGSEKDGGVGARSGATSAATTPATPTSTLSVGSTEEARCTREGAESGVGRDSAVNSRGADGKPISASVRNGVGIPSTGVGGKNDVILGSSESSDSIGSYGDGRDKTLGGKPSFPVPSPITRGVRATGDLEPVREADILSAMMNGGGVGGRKSGWRAASVSAGGSRSVPTTPVSGKGAAGSRGLDEGDILARMMAMKR